MSWVLFTEQRFILNITCDLYSMVLWPIVIVKLKKGLKCRAFFMIYTRRSTSRAPCKSARLWTWELLINMPWHVDKELPHYIISIDCVLNHFASTNASANIHPITTRKYNAFKLVCKRKSRFSLSPDAVPLPTQQWNGFGWGVKAAGKRIGPPVCRAGPYKCGANPP